MKPTNEMTYALGLRHRYCRQPVLELAWLSSIIGMALVSALRSLDSDVVPFLTTHHVSAGTWMPVPDHVVKGWKELRCPGGRSRLTSPSGVASSEDPGDPMCGTFAVCSVGRSSFKLL